MGHRPDKDEYTLDGTTPLMTWLPFRDFHDSLQHLSDYRLGRQMFEAGLVLDNLVGTGHEKRRLVGMTTRMWAGYESALGLYYSLSIREWVVRGYHALRVPPYNFYRGYDTLTLHYAASKFLPLAEIVYPKWLGDERLHASHRSALLALDPEHMKQFNWEDGPELPLYFPPEAHHADSDSHQRKIPELSEINA